MFSPCFHSELIAAKKFWIWRSESKGSGDKKPPFETTTGCWKEGSQKLHRASQQVWQTGYRCELIIELQQISPLKQN